MPHAELKRVTEPQTMPQETTSALADGLFWYAEKLRFGFEDIQPNQAESQRIYKQAALLAHGKANLRLGEMYEQGIGTERVTALALTHYTAAWNAYPKRKYRSRGPMIV
jgi:TPR repeat protein